MTGFGRAEVSNENLTVTVEASSVNRKQSEVSLTLPRHLMSLEGELRKIVLGKISRGRVSAQFTIQEISPENTGIKLDQQLVLQLEKEFQVLSESMQRPMELTPSEILKIPNVIMTQEVSPEEVLPLLEAALAEAMDKLVEMRQREGLDLLADCKTRLQKAADILQRISARAPSVLEDYRTALITKLSELKLNGENWAEDDRVIKEIALFADRSDITEEVTRFQSHLDKFHDYLGKTEPIGRSLDFLCQELNRELNTIGAKANDAQLAQLVVEGKTEVEKIREQIQNAE